MLTYVQKARAKSHAIATVFSKFCILHRRPLSLPLLQRPRQGSSVKIAHKMRTNARIIVSVIFKPFCFIENVHFFRLIALTFIMLEMELLKIPYNIAKYDAVYE